MCLLPAQSSCLIRRNVDANKCRNIIEFEVAFKQVKKESDGKLSLCFPYPRITTYFRGCFTPLMEEKEIPGQSNPCFRCPRPPSHGSSRSADKLLIHLCLKRFLLVPRILVLSTSAADYTRERRTIRPVRVRYPHGSTHHILLREGSVTEISRQPKKYQLILYFGTCKQTKNNPKQSRFRS